VTVTLPRCLALSPSGTASGTRGPRIWPAAGAGGRPLDCRRALPGGSGAALEDAVAHRGAQTHLSTGMVRRRSDGSRPRASSHGLRDVRHMEQGRSPNEPGSNSWRQRARPLATSGDGTRPDSRELQIARLAAQRQTSREIAGQLFISANTSTITFARFQKLASPLDAIIRNGTRTEACGVVARQLTSGLSQSGDTVYVRDRQH